MTRIDAAPLVAAMDSAGYRLTEPRRAVAELIAAREGHFSAADLLDDARVRRLGIGRATVFRSLDLLTELGVLERLELPNGEHAYVPCEPVHHHHVVCSRCGRVTEIDDRGLTAAHTTALVVGIVIGTGVFLKSAPMTQDVRTPALVMAAWVAAGLLSLAGALSYAELGAMLPAAGGEYVYLRKSYGNLAAFLFGWQRFIVAGSGSIASLGSGFAIFLAAFLPLNAVWARREVSLLGQTIEWQFGPRQLVAVGAMAVRVAMACSNSSRASGFSSSHFWNSSSVISSTSGGV